MKRINLLLLVFSLLTIGLLTESCKKDESCPTIECNSGTLNKETCACDCPTGYLGATCEQIDTSQIQALLDNGVSPKALYDGGVTLEQLYGNMYEGGLIFYLNTADGTGMVAATEDQSTEAEWGCYGIDIMGIDNVPWNSSVPEGSGVEIGNGAVNTNAILMECTEDGIAAKLCRDLGVEWFLPSINELNLMYTNLHAKESGGFAADFYWSSTENFGDSAWDKYFGGGGQGNGLSKDDDYHVRAARAF